MARLWRVSFGGGTTMWLHTSLDDVAAVLVTRSWVAPACAPELYMDMTQPSPQNPLE